MTDHWPLRVVALVTGPILGAGIAVWLQFETGPNLALEFNGDQESMSLKHELHLLKTRLKALLLISLEAIIPFSNLLILFSNNRMPLSSTWMENGRYHNNNNLSVYR